MLTSEFGIMPAISIPVRSLEQLKLADVFNLSNPKYDISHFGGIGSHFVDTAKDSACQSMVPFVVAGPRTAYWPFASVNLSVLCFRESPELKSYMSVVFAAVHSNGFSQHSIPHPQKFRLQSDPKPGLFEQWSMILLY